MITQLNCKDFIHHPGICLDVRSPMEFIESAITNAHNIPLLNDENRKAVGICYKQKGQDAAITLGYQLINPIKQQLIDQLITITAEKEIKLYCARGGLRSQKMAEFLDPIGYNVLVLKGGYKAYRNYAIKHIARFKNICILSGYTGCDKTGILEQLRLRGEQVLNLEALANHKGSAFGGLGENEQPRNTQFRNLIFESLRKYDPEKRLWIESESITIGRVSIPDELWINMLEANGIEIVLPIEKRIDFIVKSYGKFDKELLIASIQKISKRLGGQDTKALCEKTENNELHEVVERLLKYYDKAYESGRKKRNCQNYVKFNLENIDAVENSRLLLQHLQNIN